MSDSAPHVETVFHRTDSFYVVVFYAYLCIFVHSLRLNDVFCFEYIQILLEQKVKKKTNINYSGEACKMVKKNLLFGIFLIHCHVPVKEKDFQTYYDDCFEVFRSHSKFFQNEEVLHSNQPAVSSPQHPLPMRKRKTLQKFPTTNKNRKDALKMHDVRQNLAAYRR